MFLRWQVLYLQRHCPCLNSDGSECIGDVIRSYDWWIKLKRHVNMQDCLDFRELYAKTLKDCKCWCLQIENKQKSVCVCVYSRHANVNILSILHLALIIAKCHYSSALLNSWGKQNSQRRCGEEKNTWLGWIHSAPWRPDFYPLIHLSKRCQIAQKILPFYTTQTEPWLPFLSILWWFLVLAGEAPWSPGVYVTPIWGN